MKGITKNYRKHFSILVIILLLLVISACGGVAPDNGSSGTDPPTISSFTSTSISITEGESVTLSWVTNAATISIDQGIGTVTAPSGSITVTPASTTTYTLTATNNAGSSTNSITITVTPDDMTPTVLPVISSFTSSSNSIGLGGSITLSWVTNATTVSIDQGIGSVTAPSGSATVTPTSIGTLNFTLTATNSAGSNTGTVKITVLPVGIIVIPQYLTIQPGPAEGKDSYIYSNYPDDNYGNINSVAIGHIVTWGSFRAYFHFNLNDLPAGADIINATLKLYQYDYQVSFGVLQGFEIGIYRINGLWEENSITWNTKPSYKSTPESTFSVTPDAITWLSWDITSLAQGWLNGSIPNYGVVLRDTDETTGNIFIKCYSSDFTDNSSACPNLEIEYLIP